jgi:hypothetical protein
MAEPATGFTPGPENPQPLNFTGAHVGPSFDMIEVPPAAAASMLLKFGPSLWGKEVWPAAS